MNGTKEEIVHEYCIHNTKGCNLSNAMPARVNLDLSRRGSGRGSLGLSLLLPFLSLSLIVYGETVMWVAGATQRTIPTASVYNVDSIILRLENLFVYSMPGRDFSSRRDHASRFDEKCIFHRPI